MLQNLSAVTLLSERSNSARNILSSHCCRPRPVSAARIAASWALRSSMGGQMIGERLASRPRRRCYGGKKGPGDRDGFGFAVDGAGTCEGRTWSWCRRRCRRCSWRHPRSRVRARFATRPLPWSSWARCWSVLSSPIDQSIARAVFGSRVRPFLIKKTHIKVTVKK